MSKATFVVTVVAIVWMAVGVTGVVVVVVGGLAG